MTMEFEKSKAEIAKEETSKETSRWFFEKSEKIQKAKKSFRKNNLVPTVNTGSLMTDHLLLSEELAYFFCNVAERRDERMTWGVQYVQHKCKTTPKEPQVLALLKKLGSSVCDLIDTIAFDLNLSRDSQKGLMQIDWITEEKTKETKEIEKTLEMKPKNEDDGVCVRVPLEKVRQSLQEVQQDLEHLETLDLSEVNECKQEVHRDAFLWCLSVYRQGIAIEKSLEARLLEEQIQGTLSEQAKVDPCSHEYLNMLLDVEALAFRKDGLIEEQQIEERLVIHRGMNYIQQELEGLEHGSKAFKRLCKAFVSLREEEKRLTS